MPCLVLGSIGLGVWLAPRFLYHWDVKISGDQLVAWRGKTTLSIALEQIVEVSEGWRISGPRPGFIVYLDTYGNKQKLVFIVLVGFAGVWVDDLIKLANQAKGLNPASEANLKS